MVPSIVYVSIHLCRQYINPATGEMCVARVNVSVRGTVHLCGIDEGKDIGRQDDLRSLFFVLSDMLNSQLPWGRMVEKDKVKAVKQSTQTSQLWRNFPSETFSFVQRLQQLYFYDVPNYKLMDAFDTTMRNLKNTGHTSYDWEMKKKESKTSHESGECEDDKSLTSGNSEQA